MLKFQKQIGNILEIISSSIGALASRRQSHKFYGTVYQRSFDGSRIPFSLSMMFEIHAYRIIFQYVMPISCFNI